MVRTRFALILYFRIVAHKAASHTLSKAFFEIDDTVQILLVLEVLFTQDSEAENLFCGASSGSDPSLFFSNYFFSLGFKPIQDNFQHDFAWVTDEANSSVVLAELQVALFRECNNQRLSSWGRPFSCPPIFGFHLHGVSRANWFQWNYILFANTLHVRI